MLFDLRALGLCPVSTGALHSQPDYEAYLGDARLQRVSIDDIELDSLPVKLIKSKGFETKLIHIWIDEARGPSVVKYRIQGDTPKGRIVDILNVDLIEVDGMWFPRELRITRSVNGIPLNTEVTKLENIRLNQAIDEALFTLGSVGIEPGESVNVTPSNPLDPPPLWDGQQLVARQRPAPFVPQAAAAVAPNANSRALWIVLSNLVLAAACLCVAYMRRTPRESSPTKPQG